MLSSVYTANFCKNIKPLPEPYYPYFPSPLPSYFLKPNKRFSEKQKVTGKFYKTSLFPHYFKKINKLKKQKNGTLKEVTYHYCSETPEFNYEYGISPKDIIDVDYKLKKQQIFLDNTFLLFGEGSRLPLSKTVMTPNLTPNKYYGEMYNRTRALQMTAKDMQMTEPIFFTITPQSQNKPLKQVVKGNYIRMVDNKNFKGDSDYVKVGMKDLSTRFTNFRQSKIMKKIYADFGSRPVYMRTIEPTMDGAPHLHCVMFVPKKYKYDVVNTIYNILGKKSQVDVKIKFDDSAGGAVAYITKYILKSFRNSKTGEINMVGYWFAKHQIRRFTTSRTLMPLEIFRKIRHDEEYQDYYEVTKKYHNHQIHAQKYQDTKILYQNKTTGELYNEMTYTQIYEGLKALHGKDIPLRDMNVRTVLQHTPKKIASIYEVRFICPLTGRVDAAYLYEKNMNVSIVQKVRPTDKEDVRIDFRKRDQKDKDKQSFHSTFTVDEFDLLQDDTKFMYVEKVGNYMPYSNPIPLSSDEVAKAKEQIYLFPRSPAVEYLDFEIDGKEYYMIKGTSAYVDKDLIDDKEYKMPYERNNFDLMQTFYQLVFEDNPKIWVTYHNELVKRNLIDNDIITYDVLEIF